MKRTIRHTPGPYVAIKQKEDGDVRWLVCQAGEKNYLIAEIENGAPGDCLKTEKANALLFAAAPDLLLACEHKLNALAGEEYDPEAFEESVKMCRYAIAKARGS